MINNLLVLSKYKIHKLIFKNHYFYKLHLINRIFKDNRLILLSNKIKNRLNNKSVTNLSLKILINIQIL